MNLNRFMNNGIKKIAGVAGRFYFKSSKGRKFMRHTFLSVRKAAKLRYRFEKEGIHIPPFLIASIANSCNLYCSGCYARANGACGDGTPKELSAGEWAHVFGEAKSLGISFVLLAGGEPLMRQDVIRAAAQQKDIIFPIFTNGTLIGEEYLALFDECRNLIPILSIEGSAGKTDERRGGGVAEKIRQSAERLFENNILYGVSITVTSENKDEVTEEKFVKALRESGCGLVFFVEYVPAEDNTDSLILSDIDLTVLQQRIAALRSERKNKKIILLSFPGDENLMGGCLAAGRGFFHINASGGAEPCPFSPYSEDSIKDSTLLEIIKSPFFGRVRAIGSKAGEHKGGCTLFVVSDKVKGALDMKSKAENAE